MKTLRKKTFLIFTLLASFALTGCASSLSKQSYDDQISADPFVKTNRAIHSFNDSVDKAILKPAATVYSDYVPLFFQAGINNFLNNLGEPVSFVNNILQLKIDDSLVTFTRFAFNSTLGLGGLIDITGLSGLEEQEEDFGQTLAYWGVKPGPYVVLPFLGPSNLRDAVSLVPDRLLQSQVNDEITDTNITVPTFVLNALDTRASLLPLDKVIEQQIDPYSFIKSAYEQNRISAIHDGNPPDADNF